MNRSIPKCGSRLAWPIVAAAILALAVACGGESERVGGVSQGPDGAIDYASLSGEILIDGSSTVYPITQAMAEDFGMVSQARVNVAFSGTGGGFEKFCRGETHIANASRPIKSLEIQACADGGIEDLIEISVAMDALTVAINPANDFVDCLTTQQLFNIFREGGVTKWNEVDPSFPAEDISKYFPGTDSGTFDYFQTAIITATDPSAAHTGDGTSSEDDNVLAVGIEGDEHGIGYFGIAYYLGAGSQLRPVSVNAGAGCVPPSAETTIDGTYVPLSRPLYIYTSASLLEDRPEVLGFVNYYLENASRIVPEVGYINLPDDLLAKEKAELQPFLQ